MQIIKRATISILFLSIFFVQNVYPQEKFLSLKKDKVNKIEWEKKNKKKS